MGLQLVAQVRNFLEQLRANFEAICPPMEYHAYFTFLHWLIAAYRIVLKHLVANWISIVPLHFITHTDGHIGAPFMTDLTIIKLTCLQLEGRERERDLAHYVIAHQSVLTMWAYFWCFDVYHRPGFLPHWTSSLFVLESSLKERDCHCCRLLLSFVP